MSINFNAGGYSNPMMMGGINQMGGMNGTSTHSHSGNYFEKLKEEYGCEDCFRFGPAPRNCQMHVTPVPLEVTRPSFLRRLSVVLFG